MATTSPNIELAQRRSVAKTARFQFSLPALPLEIQILILRACLVIDVPLVNFGNLKMTVTPPPEADHQGRKHVNLAILQTCRLYYTEGWKLVWRCNTFVILPKDINPMSVNLLFRGYPRNTPLRHLSLRYFDLQTQADKFMALLSTINALPHLPHLESLDLVVNTTAPVADGLYSATEYLQNHLREVRNNLHDRNRYNHCTLKRVTFTGLLPFEDVFLVTGLLARMRPGAKLGREYLLVQDDKHQKVLRQYPTSYDAYRDMKKDLTLLTHSSTTYRAIARRYGTLRDLPPAPDWWRCFMKDVYGTFEMAYKDWVRFAPRRFGRRVGDTTMTSALGQSDPPLGAKWRSIQELA